MKKTWLEKMRDKPGYPKELVLEERFPCYNAVHKMGVDAGELVVIVNPSEIIPLMAKVPFGKAITLADICIKIAQEHGVKGCCSLVSGIYTMTIANAVEEVIATGEAPELANLPYWRTLKNDGFLNDKYPGGQEAQKAKLEAEGITLRARGKKFQVLELERHLFQL